MTIFERIVAIGKAGSGPRWPFRLVVFAVPRLLQDASLFVPEVETLLDCVGPEKICRQTYFEGENEAERLHRGAGAAMGRTGHEETQDEVAQPGSGRS